MCGIQLCSISSFPTNITFIQNLLSLSQTRLVNFEIRFWTLIEFCVVTMHYRLCTSQVRHTDISQDWNFKFEILLIRDVVVKHCYRRFGCETIPPTQKFISINLLQMSCMITRDPRRDICIQFFIKRKWRFEPGRHLCCT